MHLSAQEEFIEVVCVGQLFNTFNPFQSNFLPPAYSPALIYYGREIGWWITCYYPTVLKYMAYQETERVQLALSVG
jgi:hypothetical protein